MILGRRLPNKYFYFELSGITWGFLNIVCPWPLQCCSLCLKYFPLAPLALYYLYLALPSLFFHPFLQDFLIDLPTVG